MGTVAEKPATAAPATVPIRGTHDLDLNCPSIAYQFPPGTLRCESCRAVAAMITFLVDAKFSDPLDAVESVCDTLETESALKQRRNGLRYWCHAGTAKYLLDHDATVQARNKLFVDDAYDETQVTYHTKVERETLPCAHHFLKKYCGGLLESHMDCVEVCLDEFTRSSSAGPKRKKPTKTEETASSANGEEGPAAAAAANGGADAAAYVPRRATVDALHQCLYRRVCSHLDCEPRQLAKSERDERVRFMKYQAMYGTAKFQYVADVDDENKLQKNPYARGGPKARENEYLRMRPDEL